MNRSPPLLVVVSDIIGIFWIGPKTSVFLYNVAHTINISLMIAKLINLQVNDNPDNPICNQLPRLLCDSALIYGTYVLRAFCK